MNDSIKIHNLHLESNSPGIGLQLYDDNSYLGTYLSYEDFLYDLSFRYSIDELEKFIDKFTLYDIMVKQPYKYRGVCSELFCPTERINRYIYYSDSIHQLLEKFDEHEQRAIKYEDKFIFGVQGIGIHLYNKDTK